MPEIRTVNGLEVLDSRGHPTVRASCELASGHKGRASVPSGASTGSAEAHELRDEEASRYRGRGCRKAVRHLNRTLEEELSGRSFADPSELDQWLIERDGTPDKSNLGANTLLSLSLAFARAAARANEIPLHAYFNMLPAENVEVNALPRPTINLFSGGIHGGHQTAIQDVLIVPASAESIDRVLSDAFEVYRTAADRIRRNHDVRPLTADEGGLAPPFEDEEDMLEEAIAAIDEAGFVPGDEVALAVDVAASHFYDDGAYELRIGALNSKEMVRQLLDWLDRFPIVSLEDGLAQEDWEHWTELNEQAPEDTLILGDDLLCTNPERIQRAIDRRAANALLLKVNQIGTLTEAARALSLAKSANWDVTASARSGETEDNWLADLAVGWQTRQIKVGSVTQSERLAKYNRLLEIEKDTDLPLVNWPE